MIIKSLNIHELSKIYTDHMVKDFPPSELKPLDRIISTTSTGLCQSIGFYQDDTLCGYAIFILPPLCDYILLDYFAILKEYRGTGLGHICFSLLKDFFNTNYSQLKGIYIECESVKSSSDSAEANTRNRRILFYADNGCIITPLCSNLFGVEYTILLFPLVRASQVSYELESLDNIYRHMFKKHHYENAVSLWINQDLD